MTDINQCMVCLENISESDSYTLSCDHIFHTNCIMNWFRSRSSSGNCPLCNDTGSGSSNTSIFYGSKVYYEERYKQVKKYVNKNKKKYPVLKEDINKIKDLEKDTKDKLKIKNSFLKENKEIREKMRQQQKDYWKSVRKENKEKMKVISKCPLLIL